MHLYVYVYCTVHCTVRITVLFEFGSKISYLLHLHVYYSILYIGQYSIFRLRFYKYDILCIVYLLSTRTGTST